MSRSITDPDNVIDFLSKSLNEALRQIEVQKGINRVLTDDLLRTKKMLVDFLCDSIGEHKEDS